MAVDKSINVAMVMGTCGRDPDIKTLASSQRVANVSIATDEGYYDKSQQWVDATEWHRITAWGNLCKKMERVKKGDVILVEGKIHTDSWDDPQSGQKRYSTCIIARRVKHVDDKGRAKAAREAGQYGGGQQPGYAPPPGYAQSAPAVNPPQPAPAGGYQAGSGMPPAPEDDLPF